MNRSIKMLAVLTLGTGMFFFTSCKRDELDTETVSTTDNALCESEFLRVFPEANGIAIGEEGVQRIYPGNEVFSICPNDSVDPADTLDGFPVTLILDYGTGCTGNDGKSRKGIVRCVFMNPYDGIDDTVNITLENYYVNNIHYEGSVQVLRSPTSFTQKVTNGRCTKADWEILWGSTRTCSWVSGQNTPTDPNDDIFEYSGNASGTNREGKTFDVNITSPLVRGKHCTYITKGTMELTPEGRSTRIVDFGDGTCDNKATLTINGNKFQFNLQ